MKKLICILVLGLLWGGMATAKINWEERNLCKKSDYKNLCSKIIDKKLVGLNTIVNFKFDKGKIIALIPVQNGENISLLIDPDLSYVAKYTGEYLVYINLGGIHITEFSPAPGLEHLICDDKNRCINASKITH